MNPVKTILPDTQMKMTNDDFFKDLYRINDDGITIYPHESTKRGSSKKGLKVTLTGDKKDYHIVSIEEFIQYIAKGSLSVVGNVKMKSKEAPNSNGFAVRLATMSEALIEEVNRIKKANH